MLGGLTLRLGLFSRVYQLHKRKHIKILCIHECDSAGSSPAGGGRTQGLGQLLGKRGRRKRAVSPRISVQHCHLQRF